jgi:hypothetical protein
MNSHDGALESPSLNLGTGSSLTFWHWIDSEVSGAYAGRAYDGGVVEISIDGGSTWLPVEPEGGYPYTIRNTSTTSPFEDGRPCFAGRGRVWVSSFFDLSSFVGSVKIAGVRVGQWLMNTGWVVI